MNQEDYDFLKRKMMWSLMPNDGAGSLLDDDYPLTLFIDFVENNHIEPHSVEINTYGDIDSKLSSHVKGWSPEQKKYIEGKLKIDYFWRCEKCEKTFHGIRPSRRGSRGYHYSKRYVYFCDICSK